MGDSRRLTSHVPKPPQGILLAALDSLAAHICIIDKTGTIVWVNSAWIAFSFENCGDTDRTSVGVNYIDVCKAHSGARDESGPVFANLLQELLDGRRSRFEVDYPCHSKETYRWYLASVTRFEVEGEVFAVISHSAVTSLKRKGEIDAHQSRMESLGVLSSGIAHEFNNILAAVLGNIKLLMSRTSLSDIAYTQLELIQRACVRGSSIARELLSFKRGPSSQHEMFGLISTLKDACSLAAVNCPAGVRLVVSLPENDFELYAQGSAAAFQQSILNLLSNSMLAMENRRGSIVVEAALAGPVNAAITVCDDGCGIPDSEIHRIFEPFFTSRESNQGTGFGLYQVYSTVSMMGGSVSVHSKLGVGTRVRILVPAANADSASMAHSKQLLENSAHHQSHQQKVHILLLDDDEVVLLTHAALLRSMGHTVTSCSRPSEAIKFISERDRVYDVLITDFNMPEMSGIDVCLEARKHRPCLEMILISGRVEDPIRSKCLSLGVSVINKERAFQELQGAVAAAARSQ